MKSHFFRINEYNYFISLKFYGWSRNLGQLKMSCQFRTKFMRDQWQTTNTAVPNQSQYREAGLGEVVIQPSAVSATTLILANHNAEAIDQ